MSETPVSLSVDEVLSEFLAEQEKRLAPRTFRNYAYVIELLRHCLNGYGHQSLGAAEYERWQEAYDGDEEAFVHNFGPDKIAENLGEFLNYFMIRKVMAGEELLRAAGTVTKKLAKWLGERGHLDENAVETAVERGADAARDLPKAERLSRLLFEQAGKSTIDARALDEEHYVEDYLMRKARLASYNDYRRAFKLRPLRSFEDLTGDAVVRERVQRLYGDIDSSNGTSASCRGLWRRDDDGRSADRHGGVRRFHAGFDQPSPPSPATSTPRTPSHPRG